VDEIEKLISKIKKNKNRRSMLKLLDQLLESVKEESDLLKLQLAAREKELEECKKELEDIHNSISYRVGRWIAETKVGGKLKKFLRKYI